MSNPGERKMIQISLWITDHQHPRANQAPFRRIDGNRKSVVTGHDKWAEPFGAQEFFEILLHENEYGSQGLTRNSDL